MDWFNNRRLLEPIGNIPPAEAEQRYYAMLEQPAMAAYLKPNGLRQTRGGSEIANATEAVQDGRIYIEKINEGFLFKEGGTPAEYSAALAYTIAKGWLWKHESGTYVKFTPAGAELFA